MGPQLYSWNRAGPVALFSALAPSPQVQSLSELTAAASGAGGASEVAPCVVIKGVKGYASFLNGTYRRIEGLSHESR